MGFVSTLNYCPIRKKEKILYSTIETFIVAIIPVIFSRFFYLFPAYIGAIKTDDIMLSIVIILMLIVFSFENNFQIRFTKSIIPLFFILFSIGVSLFSAKIHWNQGFLSSIIIQRSFLINVLFFFLFLKGLRSGNLNVQKLCSLFVFWGCVGSCIYLLQRQLYHNFRFVFAIINLRNGPRIYADSVLADFTLIYSIHKLIDRRGRYVWLIPLVISSLHLFLVSQGRLEIISIIIGVIGMIFLKSKINLAKSSKYILAVIFLITIIMFEYSFDGLSSYDSMAVRTEGHELYFEQLSSNVFNLFFGMGYPRNELSLISSQANEYNLVDNGMYAYLYVYGLFGVLPVLMLFFKLLKDSSKEYIEFNHVFFFGVACVIGVLSYNIIFWWWKPEWTFCIGLLFAYLYNRGKRNETNHIVQK